MREISKSLLIYMISVYRLSWFLGFLFAAGFGG